VKKFLRKIFFWIRRTDFKTKMVAENPLTNEIPTKTIVIVGAKDWNKWAFMKCPCGCGDVLTLSLMKSFEPNWQLSTDKKKRVTLSPSVWKKDGCKSHFFVQKGKLIWV
jgi:hypothetical protein